MGKLSAMSDFSKKEKKLFSVEELIAASTINLDNCEDKTEILENLMMMFLRTVPIAEGLYRKVPKSTNAYALDKLVERLQSLMDQVESQRDLSAISKEIIEVIVKPLTSALVLELGSTLKDRLDILCEKLSPKATKKIKAFTDECYLDFAQRATAKITTYSEKVEQVVKSPNGNSKR